MSGGSGCGRSIAATGSSSSDSPSVLRPVTCEWRTSDSPKEVPVEKVGLLLGTRGTTIQKMRRRCKVRLLQLADEKKGAVGQPRTVVIAGDEAAVARAKAEIEAILVKPEIKKSKSIEFAY